MEKQESAFKQAVDFIIYVDSLKLVQRRNALNDGSRRENTAEHSWHAALAAILLAPHANGPVDIDKVVRMLLIHDLVEIEAGDTFVYDRAAVEEQEALENEAAEQIFSQLPEDQGADLLDLWQEFEARETPEAKFAKAVDRFIPLLSNAENGGFSWKPERISRDRVRDVLEIIQEGSAQLWALTEEMIDKGVEDGLLQP
jgi:putative hydrolase of HD superfamily